MDSLKNQAEMYIADPLVTATDLTSEWRRFVSTGELDAGKVRPLIGESWRRSREIGLDPFRTDPVFRLSGDMLHSKLREHSLLIRIAKPLMESLSTVLKKEPYWVTLYSPDGHLLWRIGRPADVSMLETLGCSLGTCKREDVAGTTGFALVSRCKAPVQILGPEHYFQQWHPISGSYAPILDSSGTLVGVFGIGSSTHGHHEHTLGMVIAIAAATAKELELHTKAHAIDVAAQELEAIINSINDAVIAVNLSGEIHAINRAGLGLLARQLAPGQPPSRVDEVIVAQPRLTTFLEGIVRDPATISDRRVRFMLKKGNRFDGLVSVTPILDRKRAAIGMVLVVRNLKRLEKMIGAMKQLEARYTFDDIVGASSEIQSAKRIARLAANSSSSVLLVGESGTGKELFAHAIHTASARRREPFMAVNCAAIPHELFESTLFGYEPGAFTGARTAGQDGKFQLADGGTLFLDEIGDLPLELQPKLLRVISEGRVERIGAKAPVDVDVRLIAATNRNLEAAVENRRFREDLFFRINVLRIHVPALRDRPGDLKLLVEHFVGRIAAKLGKRVRGVDPAMHARLAAHSWPGNIRELENALESAVNVMEGEVLRPDDLPPGLGARRVARPAARHGLTLREVERQTIEEALRDCGGNKALVARTLRISRDTLYRKVKEHLITCPVS
ncbi:MAG: sigma 54-interacting transcriptional regulator [Candidatus Rokubacteria bacterium]|nr:sigma 54-interacting transcriptional regulator [Candidatus Rokubacteria bacterium]